ncbi:MAG: hypothetical protein BWX94_01421 [Tenericutes bacterium ADurb.Bin140]|jgi:hypothetical protein|nr:MAG: hypothetical protein BWX94_01421 [Tenericutes bacterium ADurb.Bin140]
MKRIVILLLALGLDLLLKVVTKAIIWMLPGLKFRIFKG